MKFKQLIHRMLLPEPEWGDVIFYALAVALTLYAAISDDVSHAGMIVMLITCLAFGIDAFLYIRRRI